MISGSLIKLSDAGLRTPLDWVTLPILFSTVNFRCFPFFISFSERPMVGRIKAVLPVTKCVRFSFVLTCTVNSQF